MRIDFAVFDLWKSHHTAPYHFPMDENQWHASMYEDVDSDGRTLFEQTDCHYHYLKGAPDGMVVYGTTAFGFNDVGEISDDVHHKVIRDLFFDPAAPEVGQKLLDHALEQLGQDDRIYAFFHYFGMSACARHGKLHESQAHLHALLLNNDFQVEHENVYYARALAGLDVSDERIIITWKAQSSGGCRDFAAIAGGEEIGWGQVHFLPQGDIAYLRWIYIDEKWQHQGFGTAIMVSLCAQLYGMGIRRFDTDTALNNHAAQGYYEKTGFTNEGITRSYFRNKNN